MSKCLPCEGDSRDLTLNKGNESLRVRIRVLFSYIKCLSVVYECLPQLLLVQYAASIDIPLRAPLPIDPHLLDCIYRSVSTNPHPL